MKNRIVKYVLYGVSGIILLLVLTIVFFVKVVEPSEARMECDAYARENSAKTYRQFGTPSDAYDFYYTSCFRSRGLEAQ